jgi:hypothetical protein
MTTQIVSPNYFSELAIYAARFADPSDKCGTAQSTGHGRNALARLVEEKF